MHNPWFGSVCVYCLNIQRTEVKRSLHLGLEHWRQISTDFQVPTGVHKCC